jgi:hypothetical protein
LAAVIVEPAVLIVPANVPIALSALDPFGRSAIVTPRLVLIPWLACRWCWRRRRRKYLITGPGLYALVAKFREPLHSFTAARCVERRRRWSHQARFIVLRRKVSKILNRLVTRAIARVIVLWPKSAIFAALIRVLVLHADPELARSATGN